jgi:hypothetical protein
MDATGPSPDAIIFGVESGIESGIDADTTDVTTMADAPLGGKSCTGLPDGTVCGATPDVCHDAPVCSQGSCSLPAAKADGTVCGMAPDVCHSDATCSSGTCGPPPDKADGTLCGNATDGCHTPPACKDGKCEMGGTEPDGTNWSAGDATAICCAGQEVLADTNTDCGACGIACNASNGESCAILGGHYFCRGCMTSSGCWSQCCSTSFTPYSCAASDCAGACDAMYCPTGTHCVVGGTTSSDYCSY